jgi:hypothetical protein
LGEYGRGYRHRHSDWFPALHIAGIGGLLKEEPTSEAITHLLEECRMVLPGIQALFGFQLMVVFNSGFREHLTSSEQRLHLFAMILVALAVVLVMTPAAYHRQTRDNPKPEQFIALSSRLLLWSMFPLMAAIGIEVYVIARLILDSAALSLTVAIALLLVFLFFWFLLPHSKRLPRFIAR